MGEIALAGNLVSLRRFFPDDAPVVQSLVSDAAIADTTLNIPHPYPPGAAAEWIATHEASFENGAGATFAVTARASGGLVGCIGISVDHAHRHGEIGYWIGYPYWGRGYGTAALRLMIAHCFTQLDLHRVCAHHFARNPASGRVMQKAGMHLEGMMREHIRKSGRYETVALYGLLRRDFEAGAIT